MSEGVKVVQQPVYKIAVTTKDGSVFNFDVKGNPGVENEEDAKKALVGYLEEVITHLK